MSIEKPVTKPFGIGIDFGTTNSTAAIFDGDQTYLVQLENESAIMPSATYINRAFVTTCGQDAIDLYVQSNMGRKVELSAEVIGEVRTSTGFFDQEGSGTEGDSAKIYGQSFIDGGLPGRLFRGIKRLLGSDDSGRLMVFDHPFRLVALITPLLLRIRQSIEKALKSLPNKSDVQFHEAYIGHPVNFEGREENHNQIALQRLGEACRHAGIRHQTFYPEPNAAAVSFMTESPQATGSVILSVDFGGGTLDFCVLKKQQTAFEVVATHGIGLGGDHIDQQLFRCLLFPLLGQGERWSRRVDGRVIDTLFPFQDYEDLLIHWPVSYMLNQNRYITPVLDRLKTRDSTTIKFQRLYELIKQNYSYRVFQGIKEVKALLSSQYQAVLDIPEIDVELNLNRDSFETIIDEQLRQFRSTVEKTLILANTPPDRIDLVLRTGGSSLIPAVKRILEEIFPGKVVEHDPFTSVAAGLAISDYYSY